MANMVTYVTYITYEYDYSDQKSNKCMFWWLYWKG